MSGGPLLAFYADDFTGATDALEAVSREGARAALFLEPPGVDELRALGAVDVVGVAGDSRTWTPERMRAELPAAFAALGRLGAPLLHYKVCSTFDSGPEVGNLAVAAEIGAATLGGSWVPVLPGAPALGRWCVFGTLFARDGDGTVRRLDRHPIARHPVTPMREAGVIEHLAALGGSPAALVPTHLAGPPGAEERLRRALTAEPQFVVFDTADDDDLSAAARLVWNAAERDEVRVVVGGSAAGSAIVRQRAPREQWQLEPAPPEDDVIVLSGSCSAITAGQIEAAAGAGWALHAVNAARLGDDELARAEEAIVGRPERLIVHTALGPDDPRAGDPSAIGDALGRLADWAVERAGVRRLVVAGGDSSSAVARALGIRAVEVVAATTPGAPLCRAHAPGRAADRLEVVFKGGNLGGPDYFERVCTGF